jgi:integrase
METAMKPMLKLITPNLPTTVFRAVAPRPPRRPKNSELRAREYLTPTEVDQLIAAAKGNRYGHRDATMILIAYRHGLRAAEICDLRWSQIDLDQARMHVRRVKRGTPSVHPLQGDELRALRRLKRESPPHSDFLFMTERGGPFTTTGFAFLVSRAGAKAGLPFKAHPHMLRHAAGYKLANDGHDTRSLQAYLGHRNIQHTVRYTELAANRFDAFWR